jgi:hypothetical protein
LKAFLKKHQEITYDALKLLYSQETGRLCTFNEEIHKRYTLEEKEELEELHTPFRTYSKEWPQAIANILNRFPCCQSISFSDGCKDCDYDGGTVDVKEVGLVETFMTFALFTVAESKFITKLRLNIGGGDFGALPLGPIVRQMQKSCFSLPTVTHLHINVDHDDNLAGVQSLNGTFPNLANLTVQFLLLEYSCYNELD